MSPSRTGPLTLRMMERFGSSMNSTRTWVTLPVLPVRPSTRLIFASLIGAVSMVEQATDCRYSVLGCFLSGD
ncbi:unnamed protein product, partial [Pelagomonas calceolata]